MATTGECALKNFRRITTLRRTSFLTANTRKYWIKSVLLFTLWSLPSPLLSFWYFCLFIFIQSKKSLLSHLCKPTITCIWIDGILITKLSSFVEKILWKIYFYFHEVHFSSPTVCIIIWSCADRNNLPNKIKKKKCNLFILIITLIFRNCSYN